MTKERQKKRKRARRLGLTKQKIPHFQPLPRPTEEEPAEAHSDGDQPDLFKAGLERVR
jgi:hypothetical protein